MRRTSPANAKPGTRRREEAEASAAELTTRGAWLGKQEDRWGGNEDWLVGGRRVARAGGRPRRLPTQPHGCRMTKQKFMEYCRKSAVFEGQCQLRVHWGVLYRSLDRGVTLQGNWSNSSVLEVLLYTPSPGRQGHERHSYAAANAACEREAAKYTRWLREFLAATPEAVRGEVVGPPI